jgi:hypothetical protein
MNIKSAKYYTAPNETDNEGIEAVIDDLIMHVPLNLANRHYAAILEWAKEDGNEIAAAD